MTMRPNTVMAMMVSMLTLALAGCGGESSDRVAHAPRTRGTAIEMPVPAASPSGNAPARATNLAATPGDAPRATIGFPGGGATLDAEARALLDRLAADPALRQGTLVLRGHSDSEGDDDANRRMSRRRAEAVRDYLADKGVVRNRMNVIALGETRPVAPNARPDGSDDSAGRARNRRVEITLGPAAG